MTDVTNQPKKKNIARSLRGWFDKYWKLIGTAALVVALGLVAALLIEHFTSSNTDDNQYLLQVGEQKLALEDYQELQKGAIFFNLYGDEFNSQLIDKLVDTESYKAIGIEVTEDEIQQADAVLYGSGEVREEIIGLNNNTWRRFDVEWYALGQKIEELTKGNYRGAVLSFYYGRYKIMPADGVEFGISDETVSPELFGDSDAILADKDYAYGQAKDYMQKIESEPALLDAYIEEINSNSRLSGYMTSMKFGYDDIYWFDEIRNQNVISLITSLQESGISELQIATLPTNIDSQEGEQETEAAYWFVYLDENSVFAEPGLKDEFIQQKQTIDEAKMINLPEM